MRRVSLLLAVTATIGVAVTEASAGGVQKFPTEVTFRTFCGGGFCDGVGDDWQYFGDVDSPKRACKVGRRVNVFHKFQDDRPVLMGYDLSDSRGHWYVQGPDHDDSDEYYAVAPRKKLRSGAICKPDRSPSLSD